MNKTIRIDSFFLEKKKNIDNLHPSELTSICNVEVMVAQLQPNLICKEPALIIK
jgi:hypothetical protein